MFARGRCCLLKPMELGHRFDCTAKVTAGVGGLLKDDGKQHENALRDVCSASDREL